MYKAVNHYSIRDSAHSFFGEIQRNVIVYIYLMHARMAGCVERMETLFLHLQLAFYSQRGPDVRSLVYRFCGSEKNQAPMAMS